ncbi:hypothetical protein CK203_035212 [Vitis vinifera]|uniref:Uncharacterized protein n=1 Tax=Vitis vinifera TaxID=29760 RepID=A0A438HAA5_VITVI|nr:hypothetical protein CK203_035212 [Vitis vinifera]
MICHMDQGAWWVVEDFCWLYPLVAENSGRFDGDGDVYFRDEPAFPGGSSMSTSDFISTGFTTSPDYLMLQHGAMAPRAQGEGGRVVTDDSVIRATGECVKCRKLGS